MFHTVIDAFFDNLHHSIFSLILFVAYIFKLSKGEGSQFKPFLSFHVIMYSSLMPLALSISIYIIKSESALYVFFFGLFVPLLSIQIYLIQTINFLNMSVAIIDFKPTVNTGKLRCILMVVGIILKFLLPEYRIVVETSNNKIYSLFLENALSVLNLVLVCVLIMKKKKINEKKLGVIIHSLLSSASFLIFQIVHCIFYMERLKKPYNIDVYTFSAYYFVFFWIISAYFTNCKFMKKYIDRDIIENPYVETEMEEVDDTAQQSKF